ncbi:MAG: hypothetical protein OXG68_15760 [Chloroflexi bacterium]|nr:hypothetical protein [Chloroflexota bacterium]
MAKRILFQGITTENHLSAVKQVLQIDHPTRAIMSVAFMNARGISLLRDDIKPIANKTTILTGIRNGITSAQGLKASLELGCSTYVVDTGSRNLVFHPKIYMSRNLKEARLVVGSANLTIGGLNSNVEASVLLNLELHKPDDMAFVQRLENQIDGIVAEFSENVLHISDNTAIDGLLVSGRVIDESRAQGPITSGSSNRRNLDTVPRMKLKTRSIAIPPVDTIREESETPAMPTPTTSPGVATPISERLTLVWKSNPLTRRDLSIPVGANTNPTGSMLFKKGTFENIDQRHYFRDDAFADLDWQFDTAKRREHYERTEGRFQIIIRDVNFGVFTLRISHNTRTDTAAYVQKNSMTQLHWGSVRELVGQEDLLERTLWLYRDNDDNGFFVIEID